MSRAITLARQAVGTVSPNPPVGAVVVRDGRIVGEGFTQPPGGAHAEVQALREAGEEARGADMYVTLEPCPHHGRTPPCADAIAAAGIRRVYVAALDPNPTTDGRGISALETRGVSVVLRDGSEDARQLVEGFAKHVTTGMPFLIAKFAVSLDGKIATRGGDSKWISGPAARRFAHELRAGADAVMVGIETALADDPRLTVRDAPQRRGQPTRVVVDSSGRLPTDAAMLSEEGKTIVAVASAVKTRATALKRAGAEVIVAPGEGGAVDLRKLLVSLGDRDITSVLVEGGATLLGSLFDQGLVDKVVAIVAPLIIGGTDAKGAVGGSGAPTMLHALRLTRVTYHEVEGDMVVTGYPIR